MKSSRANYNKENQEIEKVVNIEEHETVKSVKPFVNHFVPYRKSVLAVENKVSNKVNYHTFMASNQKQTQFESC